MRKRRVAFHVIMVSIVILSVETAGQILYFASRGHFLFQRSPSDTFNVRDFSVLTNDSRGFTAKPNYINPNYQGWFLSFDSLGFRRGKQTTGHSAPRKIVFIGDSVPFGWGVPDTSSLPSKLFELSEQSSEALGVVNAALPSYSLAQAIARYEHEIHHRMTVDTVFLQSYDPVLQIVLRGSRWQPSDNWMNFPFVSKSFLSQHSATASVLDSFLLRPANGDYTTERFDPNDTETTARIQISVRAELERLLALGKSDGLRRLIVAPLTIPPHSLDRYSRSRLFAIDLLNRELRNFADSRRDDVIFADTRRLLKGYPDSDVFIDDCCHLSERGNDVVARYLMGLL